MKNNRRSLSCILILPLLASMIPFHCKLSAQTWQYFQNPGAMPKYVPSLAIDAGGKLWYVSGSIAGRFDEIQWQVHDFQDAGIQVTYNTIKDIAIAPDGNIWCSASNRVLLYNPVFDTWTLYNPYGPIGNTNGYSIAVDPSGKVIWSANSWYEWDGINWTRGHFALSNADAQNIEPNHVRQVITDFNGEQWMLTSGSIGIETGYITPAGIIHKTSTDTVVYKMGDLGYPELISLIATQNTQGYPMFLVSSYVGQNRMLRLLSYEFGAWQNLGDSPPTTAYVNEIYQDPIGNVWMAANIGTNQPAVVRRYPNGAWQTYLLDTLQMTYLYSITGAPDGKIWVGGRKDALGALAMLPAQPINPALDPAAEDTQIRVSEANGYLQFQNLESKRYYEVIAYDVHGMALGTFRINGQESRYSVANWPSGIYLLSIRNPEAGVIQTVKLVKG